MENPPTGKLLLVGEGDFSFSVALLAKPGFHGSEIVATSFESRESIVKLQKALDNVEILEDRDVTVLFDVDCTQIHTDDRLGSLTFSTLVFNFPHIGGKSNIKRNRALLNDFFSSAVQIMEPGGQILVTLCKGQGGTPADYPVRAWQDSWQVVSLAANSGLILTAVHPFMEANYPEYNSVGFRSQDKGFNTEGALVHVFETAGVPLVPDCISSTLLSIQGKQIKCPKYIEDKLNGKLLYTSGHPLCKLRSDLERMISKETPSHICFPEDLPVVMEGAESDCYLEGTDPEQLRHFPDGSSAEDSWLSGLYVLNTTDEKCEADCSVDNERDEDSQCAGGGDDTLPSKWVQCHLRTTVLEQLPLITSHDSDRLAIASCDVYNRCCISANRLPVSHEMTVVCQNGKNIAADPVKTVCKSLEMATSLSVSITHSGTPLVLTFQSGLQLHCSKHVELDLNNTKTKVGQIWTNLGDPESVNIVLLNLDLIVRKVGDIASPQLLWSQDQRFLRQFVSWPSKFEAFSVYNLQHAHDMSFWESSDIEFDELCFSDVIREVAGDVVVKVTLIERYHDEGGDQWSRCYRLIYMSNDLAVSYIASWKMQSLIRLETAKRLEIRLR
ncbi:ferredoxin-fold anticodon-binding domain-containing protein 1 homolog [Gigantopelta aegis]|uniref:ferredoxin-fold anticodon-binding domain-containing protein 1 homolog n=1 Tax=Gigantopelta aegis TaxID=1735272 RepID=UPI001B88E717|nr:ferredoxin-fold anticodon-binding domain-containing protein 1 homolog [Gigantopelta aegis]XP_041367873.1 ferredoxin-fold anticodon-binding domain-containing protein 1 homolog [Gigantopelta aegis]